MKCLIQFAQVHEQFRLPELQSITELHGIKLNLPEDIDVSRPFMEIELEEGEAQTLASRCILIKSVIELYATGLTSEELHASNRANSDRWYQHVESARFRFSINAYNHSISKSRKVQIMESFEYMSWKGAIDMVNPDVVLTYFEEYPLKASKTWKKYESDGQFIQVYFGRLIAEGTARDLIHKYDVKQRAYFGNTSMDAEVSLLMANQSLASPGKLIYDPFAGTGSMLYTAAEFGASVFGSDIDGRQMRGKESTPGVHRCAAQYGTDLRIFDLATFDMTQHPWRCGDLFDAIVTDPPYGVRAGAKRLGKRPRKVHREIVTTPAHLRPAYVPPTKPYELSELAIDLVKYARYLLKPGGRLVFFLPTVNDEYAEVDIPQVEGMALVSNSLEDFGNWGRRLITMERSRSGEFPAPDLQPRTTSMQEQEGGSDGEGHTPAHKHFREKYFAGFKPPATPPNGPTTTS